MAASRPPRLRAKEVRRAAERLITLAVNECDNTIATTKEAHNDKGQIVTIETVNDAPCKLHARRIMMSYLYEIPDVKRKDEDKADWKERTKDVKHPVVEKLFREIGPKYQEAQRRKEVRRWLHPHLQAGTPPRRRRRNVHHRDHLMIAGAWPKGETAAFAAVSLFMRKVHRLTKK